MSRGMIPQSRPTVGLGERKACDAVLQTGYLAMGPRVAEFEKLFSTFFSIPYAVAVNSGTSALHLALLALGARKGREVIIPSYACVALLNAVLYTGAKPVFADMDPVTMCLSSEDAAKKMSSHSHTVAIVVVHTFGMSADIGKLRRLGTPLIEDCTHSIGGFTKNGRRMGTLGDAAIFSFYATKMMTTGEGGMIVTASRKIFQYVRGMRVYNDAMPRRLSFNYKMSDIAAGIGTVQLSKLKAFIKKRREIARCYDTFFKRYSNVTLPRRDFGSDVFYRFVILMPDRNSARRFMQAMQKNGIICDAPVNNPLHRCMGLSDKQYPGTTEIFNRAVSLPIYPSLTKSEIKKILSETKITLARIGKKRKII